MNNNYIGNIYFIEFYDHHSIYYTTSYDENSKCAAGIYIQYYFKIKTFSKIFSTKKMIYPKGHEHQLIFENIKIKDLKKFAKNYFENKIFQ